MAMLCLFSTVYMNQRIEHIPIATLILQRIYVIDLLCIIKFSLNFLTFILNLC